MDKKKSDKIIRSVLVSFFATLGIIVLTLAMFFLNRWAQNSITHTSEVRSQIYNVSETILKIESGQRGYILTNDTLYLKTYKEGINELPAEIEELKMLVINNNNHSTPIRMLDSLLAKRLNLMEESIAAYRVGDYRGGLGVISSDKGIDLMREIEKVRNLLLEEENKLLAKRKQTYDIINFLNILSLFIGLLLMLSLLYRVWKQLIPLFIEVRKNNKALSVTMKHRDEEIALKESQMERNEELIHQLEDKNKQLNQFAYIASHDLQEPLRTVDNFITLFEEDYAGKLDDQANQYFGFIHDATQRMKNLITGLLNYSRLGKSGVKSTVDLNTVLDTIEEDFQMRIEEKNVSIHRSSLPMVEGYPVELKQLFTNLISNAIKFTPEDRSPEITITYEDKGKFHSFSIADNGLGIKEEHLDKIFSMFTRLHSTKDYEGTGIGLAFCQKIIELHRGTLSVTSALGEGSTFTFTLRK